MPATKEFSFIDFILSLVDVITNPNGKKEDPYDVNFANHYKSFYDFEENCRNGTKIKPNVQHIVQDKKNKSITATFSNDVDAKKAEKIKQYCKENDIDCNISRGKLRSVTITKNTKGVLEDRKWKEKK